MLVAANRCAAVHGPGEDVFQSGAGRGIVTDKGVAGDAIQVELAAAVDVGVEHHAARLDRAEAAVLDQRAVGAAAALDSEGAEGTDRRVAASAPCRNDQAAAGIDVRAAGEA